MVTPPSSLTPPSPWEPAASAIAAQNVRTWWQRAQQAYPPNTLRAWRADWQVFLTYCQQDGKTPLPASGETVAGFVRACRAAAKKPATTQRYLATLALAHRVAGLENPIAEQGVQLELKAYRRSVSSHQRQAHPIGWTEIESCLRHPPRNLRDPRDAALLCVAYDTMARRSELVAFDVEHLQVLSDGTGRLVIQRSKTDPFGEGHLSYLSRQTVRHVLRWQEQSGITTRALFRRIAGRHRAGERLTADAISPILKSVAQRIALPTEQVRAVSGHSVRVGAAQDLLALNIDLASVMQAGRWASARMPMRYGEHVLAARGGMARAAALQGRD